MPKKGKTKPITACPHTDRKHQALGMCRRCYSNRPEVLQQTYEWRKRNPDKYKATWKRFSKKSQKGEWWRPAYLMRLYGITIEQYDEILKRQDYTCAICKIPDKTDLLGRRLAVDHDHITGTVRGLLCTGCNTDLGKLESKRNWTILAEEYLRRYQCK